MNPFEGMDATKVLTNEQLDKICSDAEIPNVVYETSKTNDVTVNKFISCDYDVPKTIGFYQLRNTLANLTEPFNTYLFVSDANAPVPAFDVDTSPDGFWDNPDNVKKVSDSLFLFHDSTLFEDIKKIPITGEAGEALFRLMRGRDRKETDKWITWDVLYQSNLWWHAQNKPDVDGNDSVPVQGIARSMYAVF